MLHHRHFPKAATTNNPLGGMPLPAKERTLAQADSGQQVTITGFGSLSPIYRQHLQAYGLLPGRTVLVLAQQPITIVMIEQTELAFEGEIARQVLVK